MIHSEQVAQIKLLMARLDSGTNVDAGGLRLNPTSSYTDVDLAAKERDMFFRSRPQLIGMSCELPEPHSFVTIDELGTPIVATRDGDGVFRAFVNACRHRGVAVESRQRGTTRRFTCPFHSWSYDTGGALVGLPHQDQFGDIDKSCNGLVELPAEEWNGLLFVHPQPDGEIDVGELLGAELGAELANWDFARMELLDEVDYPTDCNWKLAMDTFGETYHFSSLHADTLAMGFYSNNQCYDTYGIHHRMLLTRRDIDTLRDLPEDEWDITTAALPVYWLFPNVQLMPQSHGCYLVRAYPHPEDPGKHVSKVTFYMRPGVMDSDLGDLHSMVATRFGQVIRDEDYVASASQQRTASSGALDHVVFGRNEPALHHYHNTYRSLLGQELLPLVQTA